MYIPWDLHGIWSCPKAVLLFLVCFFFVSHYSLSLIRNCLNLLFGNQGTFRRLRSVFFPNLKKGSAKECSNYLTIALISPTSKVMLKILQTRLQQYVNWELPDVQAWFRKGKGTRDQIGNIRWIIEKTRKFKKNICFIDYTKVFDCADHNKLWEILRDGNSRSPYLPPENLYVGHEATVRMRLKTMDLFKIGKGVHQGCTLPLCLFNFMHNTSWEIPGWTKHSWNQDCWEIYQ